MEIFESPIGPLLLRGEGGVLTGVSLWRAQPVEADGDIPQGTREQLDAYFAGDLSELNLPLELRGPPFDVRVWQQLPAIPCGETISYGELADRIGAPGEARKVGAALGRNPIMIVVPCHRVIGANGDLVGFGGGLDRKRFLLDHEAGRLTLV